MELKSCFNTIWIEIRRNWFLVFISMFMMFSATPEGIKADIKGVALILYPLGLVTFIILVIHTWRKLAFPYINLGQFAQKAKEEPLAAGVVTAATLYMIVEMVKVCVSLIK